MCGKGPRPPRAGLSEAGLVHDEDRPTRTSRATPAGGPAGASSCKPPPPSAPSPPPAAWPRPAASTSRAQEGESDGPEALIGEWFEAEQRVLRRRRRRRRRHGRDRLPLLRRRRPLVRRRRHLADDRARLQPGRRDLHRAPLRQRPGGGRRPAGSRRPHLHRPGLRRRRRQLRPLPRPRSGRQPDQRRRAGPDLHRRHRGTGDADRARLRRRGAAGPRRNRPSSPAPAGAPTRATASTPSASPGPASTARSATPSSTTPSPPTAPDQNGAAEVRAVYVYHAVTREWGDIGYNYLTDRFGNIYEGRFGGENVVGGHAYQFAFGSSGIGNLGTFNTVDVTAAQRSAIIAITAWVTRALDPLGFEDFLEAPNLPTICGHRDVTQDTCPGNALYDDLPGIRQAVKTILDSTDGPPVSEPPPPPAAEFTTGDNVRTTQALNLRETPDLQRQQRDRDDAPGHPLRRDRAGPAAERRLRLVPAAVRLRRRLGRRQLPRLRPARQPGRPHLRGWGLRHRQPERRGPAGPPRHAPDPDRHPLGRQPGRDHRRFGRGHRPSLVGRLPQRQRRRLDLPDLPDPGQPAAGQRVRDRRPDLRRHRPALSSAPGPAPATA